MLQLQVVFCIVYSCHIWLKDIVLSPHFRSSFVSHTSLIFNIISQKSCDSVYGTFQLDTPSSILDVHIQQQACYQSSYWINSISFFPNVFYMIMPWGIVWWNKIIFYYEAMIILFQSLQPKSRCLKALIALIFNLLLFILFRKVTRLKITLFGNYSFSFSSFSTWLEYNVAFPPMAVK